MKVLAAAVGVYLVAGWCGCFGQGVAPGIQVLREFNAELVSADAWNGVAIDWDPSGRLWAAVTPDDPLEVRRKSRSDSIVVVDLARRGGSRARHGTFASGLRGVGGFVFYRDGLIVVEGSRIVRVRDANGDGVADKREIVFSGLGNEWEPARLGSLRWGLDGWIYGVLGRGAEGCENVVGRRSFGKLSGGIVRFKADGSGMETVSGFMSERGDMDLTWDHEMFFSRAGGPHVSHVGAPERYFSLRGLTGATSHRKVEDHGTLYLAGGRDRQRFVQSTPGTPFSMISGATVYEGGAWPERYHGNFYVCDAAHQVVHEDVISRPESAYFEGTRRLAGEFMTTTGPFRPHHVGVGPDGAMYILASGEVSARRSAHSPRWGFQETTTRAKGQIWRVQHKQARQARVPNLATGRPEELVEGLEHPNAWVRRTAQRLLVERRELGATTALERMAASSRFAPTRVTALWTLHRLNGVSHGVWTNALEDIHPAVQKNAWYVFADSERPVTPEIEKIFNRQYKEADERVKVAMLLGMHSGPLTSGAQESLAKLIPDLKDTWSKSVVFSIARRNPLDFIKVAFASDKSENFREIVVPLVEQLASETGDTSAVEALTRKHGEKAAKLTTAVKEVLAKHQQ